MSPVDIVTSPPSAWVAVMIGVKQETSLKHLIIPLQYTRNVLRTPYNFFETPLKQTVRNKTTMKMLGGHLEYIIKHNFDTKTPNFP